MRLVQVLETVTDVSVRRSGFLGRNVKVNVAKLTKYLYQCSECGKVNSYDQTPVSECECTPCRICGKPSGSKNHTQVWSYSTGLRYMMQPTPNPCGQNYTYYQSVSSPSAPSKKKQPKTHYYSPERRIKARK